MPAFVIVRAAFIILLLLLGIADYFFLHVPWFFYLLPTVFFIALLVAGTTKMSMNYFAKTYSTLQKKENAIALTFDDGPSGKYTPEVLALLKQYQAKATFFCIGRKLAGNEELLKRIIAEGHVIGNHSYSHSNFFPLLGKKKIAEEIIKTNELLENILGVKCSIFRPPFGVMNPAIAWAVKKCGMHLVGWNLRSYDGTDQNYKNVTDRIVSKLKPGSVVLLHDDRENIVQILKEVLEYAQANNFQYATAQDMLK
jgi:peptidoglycan/xylan/chitin deacetylase (PgdA/CDA1 family)